MLGQLMPLPWTGATCSFSPYHPLVLYQELKMAVAQTILIGQIGQLNHDIRY